MKSNRKGFNLEEDVIIVTGACGQLGLEYIKMFLNEGAQVVALDINSSEKLELLKKQFNTKLMFCKADVTSKSSLKSSLIKIKNKFGSPTVLVNNAAIDSPPSSCSKENGPFEKYPESSWDNVIEVNLKGVFLCCQIFGDEMVKNGKGSIINISSIYGIVSPDQSIYNYRREKGEIYFKPVAYSVSKSGILNLTRYLAIYWSKSNVRVNTLTIAGVFNNQDDLFLKAYCNRIPIGRMANKDEYNGALLFLASNASTYMTGSNLIIDGGWTSI